MPKADSVARIHPFIDLEGHLWAFGDYRPAVDYSNGGEEPPCHA
jgi:hypothetical protein